MATTNYNLPTISGASPVAIVDDYNALANATDAALAGAISGEKTRAMAAETELANGVSNALTTANSANVSATNAQTTADQASTAASAEATRATAAENALSADIANVKAMFPVDSANLADGAVTAPKLADTALNAIWQGLEIKHFELGNSAADNTGMSAPSNVRELRGWYIPAIGLLCIEAFTFADTDNAYTTLPSYVPSISISAENIELAQTLAYSGSNDFAGEHVLQMLNGTNQIHVSGHSGNSDWTQVIFAPVMFFMPPYSSAAFTNATAASDFSNASGVVGNV